MADLSEGEEDITLGELPIGSAGRKSSGWYGMLTLITTEAALFLYLLFSYYYTWIWSGRQFLPAEMPSFRLSAPDTVILILSSVAVWWGEHGIKRAPVTIGTAYWHFVDVVWLFVFFTYYVTPHLS
jgi:heme/copper-type cytochrome/quinol oxidase subunit 3